MHTHDCHMNAGGQRMVSDPVALELRVVVNYLAWMLELKTWFLWKSSHLFRSKSILRAG